MSEMNMDLVYRSLPLLLKGTLITFQILILAGLLSFCLGTLFGILICRHLQSRLLSRLLGLITFILRAVPFYVQLLMVYFVLPEILLINLEPFTASIIALGICSSGYVAQVVRCGINSIPQEQWESAMTLGCSTGQSLRYIILPQMIRNVLPALTNELDALLKSTAILSSIGLLELTRMGMNIVSREMDPLTIYSTIAVFYISMSAIINLFSKFFEPRLRYVNR